MSPIIFLPCFLNFPFLFHVTIFQLLLFRALFSSILLLTLTSFSRSRFASGEGLFSTSLCSKSLPGTPCYITPPPSAFIQVALIVRAVKITSVAEYTRTPTTIVLS